MAILKSRQATPRVVRFVAHDASYRNFIQAHSMLSLIALDVRNHEQMPDEPSWLALAGKRLITASSENRRRVRDKPLGGVHQRNCKAVRVAFTRRKRK